MWLYKGEAVNAKLYNQETAEPVLKSRSIFLLKPQSYALCQGHITPVTQPTAASHPPGLGR